ncbi:MULTISPECIES: TolC family protein [Pseudomonas]|uniref:TolC family protein n=1 Tax=Pseudomonas TaxID=286 RepID=UPI002147988D|nr:MULTISPECIES: TolC family protein [Pseudomonas]UUT23018.1 TolC family protein [Pseudomonas sp. T8]WJV26350.1 TolC family protein [Pseudomonas chlororaphis]
MRKQNKHRKQAGHLKSRTKDAMRVRGRTYLTQRFSRLSFTIALCATGLAGCATQQTEAPVRKTQRSADGVPIVTPAVVVAAPIPTAEPQHRVAIDGMTLSDAVGVAISRHPDVSRANAVIAQSTSEVAIAKAAWFPTIEYSVRPGYGQSYGSGGSSAGATGVLGVNQLLYDFGRTSSRISAADSTLKKHQYLLADTIETVGYNTATTFVELAASQEMIAAAERQVAALDQTSSRIVDRVKAGISDASDQNQANVAIQRAKAEVLKAKTRFDVAVGRLAELSGVRPRRVANLDVTSSFISGLGEGGGEIDQTPSILAAKAAMDAAHAKVKQMEAERYPSIGVGVSRSLSTGRENVNDDTFVGLTLSGSYSLGGLGRHKIAAAEDERRAAADVLESQRLITRTALGAAETEASGAAARLESYEAVIALSSASRDLYWQEYTLNKRPLTDVINAEREIYSSEVERINAIADGVLARIKAYLVIGKFVQLLRKQEGRS